MLSLFLSYSPATQRTHANDLKERLSYYGVDAFVAHEDIKPNAIWRNEIRDRLRRAHALAYLADTEGNESCWCNQEIGIALGLGKQVIVVMRGAVPVGFLSEQQGIRSRDNAVEDAKAIYEVLCTEAAQRIEIGTGLAERLMKSGSFAESNSIASIISEHGAFHPKAIDLMESAKEQNSQVREARRVNSAIASAKTKVMETE
jgi:hypothetical protein